MLQKILSLFLQPPAHLPQSPSQQVCQQLLIFWAAGYGPGLPEKPLRLRLTAPLMDQIKQAAQIRLPGPGWLKPPAVS